MMICKQCGSEFEVKIGKGRGGHLCLRALYCSEQCRRISNNEKTKIYLKKKRLQTYDYSWKAEKKCLICSSIFTPKIKQQRYCSKDCFQKTTQTDFLFKHRDIMENISPTITRFLRQRIDILDRDNFTCQYCGRNPRDDKNVVLHIDHKIPKNKGGTNNNDNLITSCQECNLGKTDVLLKIWIMKKNKK